MSWRTSMREALVTCDFPACHCSVGVRLDANFDVHAADHLDATTKAQREGWSADPHDRTADFCPTHTRLLDAITDALVEEAKTEGCTPDRAKLRVLLARELKSGGASR